MIGVEASEHMSDLAAETVISNGYGMVCTILNKDIRRVSIDDTQPLFNGGRADICVFEVSEQHNCQMPTERFCLSSCL